MAFPVEDLCLASIEQKQAEQGALSPSWRQALLRPSRQVVTVIGTGTVVISMKQCIMAIQNP